MISTSRRAKRAAATIGLAALILFGYALAQPTASAQPTLAELRAAVEADRGDVAAWVALGNAHFNASQHDLAKNAFLEAIALDYTSGDAHYGLGLAEFSRGDYQAALFEFTEVTRLHAERFDGHFNRAVTLARLRRAQDAADAFRNALREADPEATLEDRVHAQLGLAGQLEIVGDHSGAAAAYLAALELEPGNAGYILRRGAALHAAGDGLVALPELTDLETRTSDYRVSALIADIYVGQGQIDYAIWSLQRALEKAQAAGDGPAQASTYVKLGALQRSLGRDADAAASYEAAVAVHPGSWEAQYNLGVTHLESGRPRAALPALDTALRLDPQRGEIYFALATAHDQLGQSAEALGSAREAMARLSDPEVVTSARFIAGRSHFRLGDYPAANELLRSVLQARPNDAQVQLWSGLSAYQLGDYSTAIGSFERAVQLNPNSVEARVNLGAGYLAAQRYQEAEGVYQLLVEQNPRDSESFYNLGWALFSQNRRNAARDAWVASCEQGYQAACSAITTYL